MCCTIAAQTAYLDQHNGVTFYYHADYRYAECRFAACFYVECYYAEGLLNVFLPIVVMLSVIRLNVVLLIVVAVFWQIKCPAICTIKCTLCKNKMTKY